MHYLVTPGVGNPGEDLNWADWMVICHKEKITRQQFYKVIKDFFASRPSGWAWYDADDANQEFIDYITGLGYVVLAKDAEIVWVCD